MNIPPEVFGAGLASLAVSLMYNVSHWRGEHKDKDITERYVVGFAFDDRNSRVLLIKKLKPAWQHGKLNGIGGKIEHGESPVEAMVREFREECGLNTRAEDWTQVECLTFPVIHNKGAQLWVFAAKIHGCTQTARSLTAEEVHGYQHTEGMLHNALGNVIPNLLWLVPKSYQAIFGYIKN